MRLDPQYASPHVGLGELREQRRDFAGALESYQAALKLDPGNASYRRLVAQAASAKDRDK